MGTLHAPNLDWGDSAFLAQTRVDGCPWTFGHLVGASPSDAARPQARDRLLYGVDDDYDTP